MTNNRKDQIVFLDGKEEAMRTLFSSEHFGYLAIGYTNPNNGFINPETDTDDIGFHEISQTTDDATYLRIPLTPYGEAIKDLDNGKVLCKFSADLDIDNIQRNTPINQYAIVNSATPGDVNTRVYAASTFPTFTKNNKIAITFVVGFRF